MPAATQPLRGIDFLPTHEETVSPGEARRILERERDNIAAVRPVPPRLGEADFGGIHITYKQPVYRAARKLGRPF